MRTNAVLFAALAIVALAGDAVADHCTTYSTSNPELTIPDPTGASGYGTWYVDNDVCQTSGCFFSVWIYPESNGIPGLQRGDEVVDDTCHGMIESDGIPPF